MLGLPLSLETPPLLRVSLWLSSTAVCMLILSATTDSNLLQTNVLCVGLFLLAILSTNGFET